MVKKAPQAFRTITEVSTWLDEPAHVLRFWESKFSQIKPVKRAGGRRYYRPEDMELLGGIKVLLHDQGKTIKGVQELLKTEGVKHVQGFSPEFDFPSGRRRKKAAKAKADAAKTEVAKTTAPEVENTETPANKPIDVKAALAAEIATGKVALNKKPAGSATARAASLAGSSKDDGAVSTAAGLEPNSFPDIKVARSMDDLTATETSDLEDLFYQLSRVRNRMKRSLAAL